MIDLDTLDDFDEDLSGGYGVDDNLERVDLSRVLNERTSTKNLLDIKVANIGTATNNMSLEQNDDNLLTTMLITANVGTIFEETNLLELWFKQLKTYLVRVKPQFVAIHCQEVGGKNFINSMKHMSIFTDKITGDLDISNNFTRIRIFLDEDYKCAERFTALGSIYLIHKTVKDFKIYNFITTKFDTFEDISVRSFRNSHLTTSNNNNDNNNNIVEHADKVKFPHDLFPESRLSRKGFMRTRWLFNGRQMLDLVNIHLFHDASNLVAMEATPSPYALDRQRALDFTLKKISEPLKTDQNLLEKCQKHNSEQQIACQKKNMDQQYRLEQTTDLVVPLFIFGDFNFRLDTKKVIERISRGASPKVKRCADSNEVLQFVYHSNENTNDETVAGEDEDLLQENIKSKQQLEQRKISNNNLQSSFDGSTSNQITVNRKTSTVSNPEVVMTIGKKLFDYVALDETFRAVENNEWLQEMDIELDSFRSELFEFKISFSPSYPFKEDTSGAHSYMKTRCPAWCDRILFNSAGSKVIHSRHDTAATNLSSSSKTTCQTIISSTTTKLDQEHNNLQEQTRDQADEVEVIRERVQLLQNLGDIQYRLLGNSSPMGDHKPVLLYCQLSI